MYLLLCVGHAVAIDCTFVPLDDLYLKNRCSLRCNKPGLQWFEEANILMLLYIYTANSDGSVVYKLLDGNAIVLAHLQGLKEHC